MKLDNGPKNGDYVSYVENLIEHRAQHEHVHADDPAQSAFQSAVSSTSSLSTLPTHHTETQITLPSFLMEPGKIQKRLANFLFFIAGLLFLLFILTDTSTAVMPFLIFAFFVGGQIFRTKAKEARAAASTSD